MKNKRQTYSLLYFTVTLFFTTVFNVVFSQNDPLLIFQGKVTEMSGKKIQGAKIIVKKDGAVFKTVTSSSSGKYGPIECLFGHIYELQFSKEGFVSKTLALDTKKGYYAEDIEKKTYIEPSITLFQKKPNIDYSVVTSKPVGKAKIDPKTSKLDWDFAYLGQRKKEIDRYLQQVAEQARKEEELFKKLVREADISNSRGEYSLAIVKYKEALKIKDDENIKAKIVAAEKGIAGLEADKEKTAEFNKLIQAGNNFLVSNKFDEAIIEYEKAKALKPGEQISYDKIREANKMKVDLANAEINKQYNAKMSEASKYFEQKDWANAKKIYAEASTIKPSERAPKDRIIQIDGIIAKNKSDEDNYNKFIKTADEALSANNFDAAIDNYRKAIQIKHLENYPKQQITKAEQQKRDAEQESKLQNQYKTLIEIGDKHLANLELNQAKSSYNGALDLIPEDEYATKKIIEIDSKIAELEKDKLLEEENKRAYNALIINADGLLLSEQLEEAKAIYIKAKDLRSKEKYPSQKIAEIEEKLQRKKNESDRIQKIYDDLITKADQEFNNSLWDNAKRDYLSALDIFTDKQHPKDKLKEIESKIAEEEESRLKDESNKKEIEKLISEGDQEFSIDEFQKAKDKYLLAKDKDPNNSIIDNKIKRADTKLKQLMSSKKIQDDYDALITKADASRDSKEWKDAKSLYNSAINLMPNEIYPKKQIELINLSIEEDSRQEIEKKYIAAITLADEQFSKQNYNEAFDLFEKAKNIKPSEAYPNDKIREIRRLLNQNQEQERKYNALIAKADNEYESEKWELALITYQNALVIFKKEYPENRIIEIQNKLKENLSLNKDKQEKRNQYDQLITKADREFSEDNFIESKKSYQEALKLFDQEYYPKQRISEIDVKLKIINTNNQKKKKYDDLISRADASRDAKSWHEAKKLYQEANLIDAIPTYPQEQIDSINKKMKEETASEFQEQYQKLITAADNQFDLKTYEKAKELYIRARKMNPDDHYPNQRISEIDRLVQEIESNKSEEQKLQALQDKYTKLISQADGARDAEQWNKAKSYYKQANAIMPSESYPQQQVDWINKKMQENSTEEALKQYNKIIEVADKMYVDKNYLKAIELYRRAKRMKQDDPYPPAQIAKVEADRMAALDDEKTTNNYNSLIKAGDNALNDRKYRLSLKQYQNALNLRPDSPYPSGKISEINNILDKLAAENAKRNQDKQNRNLQGNYQTLYGEEVSGKYNEEQINQIFSTQRVEADDENQKLMVIRKDDLNEMESDVIQQHKSKNEDSHQSLEQINTDRSNKEKDQDNVRLKIIPQIDHYKDVESEKQDSRVENAKIITQDNYNLKEDLVTAYSLKDEDMDIPRQEVLTKVDYYKDDISKTEDERQERSKEHTFDNDLAKENLQTSIYLNEAYKDKSRQESAPKVDLYKDDISFIEESKIYHSKYITYSNYDDKENLEERISKLSIESDIPRQEIVPEIDFYKDDISNKEVNKQVYSKDVTYTNYEDKEELTARISEFTKEADMPREDIVKKVDKYKDKEADIELSRNESNSDKTFNIYSDKEMLEDNRATEFANSDINREMNATEVESYQDKQSDNLGEKHQNDIRDDYIVDQKIDEIKSASPTGLVDSYTQQLALEYPEGVTEKMFERKNTRGDIIEVTILRIVIRGNKGDEYRKVTSLWGVYYFKNGGVISEFLWDSETN